MLATESFFSFFALRLAAEAVALELGCVYEVNSGVIACV